MEDGANFTKKIIEIGVGVFGGLSLLYFAFLRPLLKRQVSLKSTKIPPKNYQEGPTTRLNTPPGRGSRSPQ